nr:Chain C, Decapeptide: THR-SER-ASN-LEU-GLN-GLU-GLN-ILE-GLY-TRP [synthetic construct]
TSNLQEQIGW